MKDLQNKIQQYDKHNMFDYLNMFYKQISEGLKISSQLKISKTDLCSVFTVMA